MTNSSIKKMIRFCLVAAVGSVATVAMAGQTWTAHGRVSHVFSGYTDGSVFVAGLEKKGPCGESLIHFTSATSDPNKIMAIATAAQLSGKRLACAVSDNSCSGPYQVGYQCNLTD
jgi:hypothetical protein